jgi:hypothetical protein
MSDLPHPPDMRGEPPRQPGAPAAKSIEPEDPAVPAAESPARPEPPTEKPPYGNRNGSRNLDAATGVLAGVALGALIWAILLYLWWR